MTIVNMSPDQIDDIIEEARTIRDNMNQTAIVRVTPKVPPGYVYKAIVDYVEQYKDMILLADNKRLYFKAVYDGNR